MSKDNLNVRFIPPIEAVKRWCEFEYCFSSAQEFSSGDYDARALFDSVSKCEKFLIAVEDQTRVVCAAVVTLHGPTCWVHHIGPGSVLTFQDYIEFREVLEKYAKNEPPLILQKWRDLMRSVNVKTVQAHTRLSAARALEKIGVTVKHATIEFKL